MSKRGLSLLNLAIGLAIGIGAGYFLFSGNAPGPVPALPAQSLKPASEQFYYRLNDSTVSRHTVVASDSGVLHNVDTLAVQPE